MPEKPDRPAKVKQRLLEVLESGTVAFSKHARLEMKKDGLEATDCVNVLRGGVVEPPELISGTWRYRVVTRKICVVIAVHGEDEVRVVTAWRTT